VRTGIFRINHSAHSTEATGAFPIEKLWALKDPFRQVASGELPVAWSFDISPSRSPTASELVASVGGEYQKILKHHGISTDTINFVNLCERNFYPRTSTDTLIISTKDKNTTTWKAAANEIQMLLDRAVRPVTAQIRDEVMAFMKRDCRWSTEGFSSPDRIRIGVEIRNDSKMHRDIFRSLSVRPDVELTVMKVQPIIEEVVQRICGDYWRGTHFNFCGPVVGEGLPTERRIYWKPTMHVGVAFGTMRNWAAVEARIREAVRDVEGDLEIHLELRPSLGEPPC
jgi:hypothetical protein